MDTEAKVAQHYSRGDLAAGIRDALVRIGKDPDRLSPADLATVDEFHLGWLPATADIARAMKLAPGMRVLDIGSGLGGPARHFAAAHGCEVTGIDLTPEFVAVARELTEATGLSDRVTFHAGSALALPFEDAAFDAATLIHVGMNIADKARLFAETRRVLRPGGCFGIFDVMRIGEGEIPMPMPWANGAAMSFVEGAEVYRARLAGAGFRLVSARDRTPFVLDLAAELRARAEAEGSPVLGLHLVIGPEARPRVAALLGCLEAGLLAPIEMIVEAA
jgi:SAM-dependent methyltransferase